MKITTIQDYFSMLENKCNHKLEYCSTCNVWMVRCNMCNNNTCNGGRGTVNDSPCENCQSAHEMVCELYDHYDDFVNVEVPENNNYSDEDIEQFLINQ